MKIMIIWYNVKWK